MTFDPCNIDVTCGNWSCTHQSIRQQEMAGHGRNCVLQVHLLLASNNSTSSSSMASEIILLPDSNKLLLIWFWAMSALIKRQSFSFLFTLPPCLLVGVAFLATSFLVLEAFLAERLVGCKVDCRADGEPSTDYLADGLSMPDR